MVGAAITACQSFEAKILLSLGGHGGDKCEYGFTSNEDATQTASNIWQLFLGGYPSKHSAGLRPFGDAVLDGIDLDIECAAQGTNPAYYTTFVQQLRALMSNSSSPDAATASLKTTSYLITAAPQCVFPDAYLGPDTEGLVLTESAMQIDYLWPQFYNNPSCQFNSTDAGAGFQQSFHNWSSWAASAAPAMEVLVGLPASPSAAGMGYMPPDVEDKQIKLIRTGNATNFDGVMLWSAAWESANAQAKQPYLPTVLGSLTDPLHSGAAAQHILKSAALLCMALMLLVCLL
ncbi:Chitinase 2 [Trebouxia sp. C0009 RCD-2024]